MPLCVIGCKLYIPGHISASCTARHGRRWTSGPSARGDGNRRTRSRCTRPPRSTSEGAWQVRKTRHLRWPDSDTNSKGSSTISSSGGGGGSGGGSSSRSSSSSSSLPLESIRYITYMVIHQIDLIHTYIRTYVRTYVHTYKSLCVCVLLPPASNQDREAMCKLCVCVEGSRHPELSGSGCRKRCCHLSSSSTPWCTECYPSVKMLGKYSLPSSNLQ